MVVYSRLNKKKEKKNQAGSTKRKRKRTKPAVDNQTKGTPLLLEGRVNEGLLLVLGCQRSTVILKELIIRSTVDNQDIAFNIPVDLYDECFYVTGILSFWILLPSCVLFVLSSSISVLSLLWSLLLMGR